MSVATYRIYPPPEGFTAEQLRHGDHWIYTDVECPHCGKVQPVAATQYVGGPCVQCGELTGAAELAALRAEYAPTDLIELPQETQDK
jgi:phage FluMu protein Com